MYEDISPKYMILLIEKINDTLRDMFEYSRYEKVEGYILKWRNLGYNFMILKNEKDQIRLLDTLNYISDNELIIKIAMDLGIETPGFIPAVSEIKNELKEENENIHDTFMKAFKSVSDSPDDAVGFANSALESIIKTILQDDRIVINKNNNDTLYELSEKILKVFKKYPGKDMPEEINMIGSGLLKASQGIEKLRSDKTDFHGKTKNDVIIKDSSYAYFIVNAVTTIGLFLLEVYKENYPKQKEFDPNDLPF